MPLHSLFRRALSVAAAAALAVGGALVPAAALAAPGAHGSSQDKVYLCVEKAAKKGTGFKPSKANYYGKVVWHGRGSAHEKNLFNQHGGYPTLGHCTSGRVDRHIGFDVVLGWNRGLDFQGGPTHDPFSPHKTYNAGKRSHQIRYHGCEVIRIRHTPLKGKGGGSYTYSKPKVIFTPC